MSEYINLRGVIPVLITPFTESYEVDQESLVRVLEFLYSKQIAGLWVLGTGGEDMSLTYRQRLRVAETVSEFNDNRLPIIVGSSFYSMQDTFSFLNETQKLDISAYHYMPYHTLIGLDNIEATYRSLAERCEKPLWMYTSANWSRPIPPDFLARFAQNPAIGGIKYSTSNSVDIEKALSYQNEQFQVITAVVKQFFSSLTLGARAGTTVEACLFPNEIVSIYSAYEEEDYLAALDRQRYLNRLIERTMTSAGRDNFLRVAEIKYALSLKGICSPVVSRPYRGLDDAEKLIIESTLRESQHLD